MTPLSSRLAEFARVDGSSTVLGNVVDVQRVARFAKHFSNMSFDYGPESERYVELE